MKLNSSCMECLIRRNLSRARSLGTEEQAVSFARDFLGMLASGPEDAAAPAYAPYTAALFQKHYGLPKDYMGKEKKASNGLALTMAPAMEAAIAQSEDPVLLALQGAILGNYLDFAALYGQVKFEEFERLSEKAAEISVDAKEYAQFCRDLEQAETLLYLTDNAGEIVFDRLLGEAIHKRYPNLKITYCVRGGPALNDATRQDAKEAGIAPPFALIDNGTEISGTDLRRCSEECRRAVESTDVILSKGQANVETLLGCGYNVYYAFLCKCPRFEGLFHGAHLEPKFCNELRLTLPANS